jgi:lipopolysaccharide export LptBFGC system permease protein LptF
MKRPASLFSVFILWLVAVLQVLRMVFRVHVTAGGVEIPLWASLVPAALFAALGVWLWAERRG